MAANDWRMHKPMPHWPAQDLMPLLRGMRDDNCGYLDRWFVRGPFVAKQTRVVRCGERVNDSLSFVGRDDDSSVFEPEWFLRPLSNQCFVVLWSRFTVLPLMDAKEPLLPAYCDGVARSLRLDACVNTGVLFNHVVAPPHDRTELLVPPLALPSLIHSSILLRSARIPRLPDGPEYVAIEVRLTGLVLMRPP